MTATVNHRTTRFQMNPFKVVEENITLPNGVTTNVAILKHPGASAIIPLLDSHTIVMIKQYRHSVGKFIWEIPAGTRDPGKHLINAPEENWSKKQDTVPARGILWVR